MTIIIIIEIDYDWTFVLHANATVALQLTPVHGLHSFVCKRVPGRAARHHALNPVLHELFHDFSVRVHSTARLIHAVEG